MFGLLGAALLTASAADGQVARGPLSVREQSPVYQLFHVPVMDGADLVGKGRWMAEFTVAYVNMFEQGVSSTHEILFDMERLGTALTLRHGLAEAFEIGARLRTQTTGGGILDPLIQGLHEAFNLSNGSREDFPSGVHGWASPFRRDADGVRAGGSRAVWSLQNGRWAGRPALREPAGYRETPDRF